MNARKLLLGGLLGTAAIATPLALAGTATAATSGPGTYSYVTSYGGQQFPHDGTTQYTCNSDGSIGFTFQGDETAGIGDGHGTGLIDSAGSTFVMTGLRSSDGYSYSFSGDLAAGGTWTLTGQNDSAGDAGVHAAGTFVGIPNCHTDPGVVPPAPVVAPPTPKGNHGEYVSGATH